MSKSILLRRDELEKIRQLNERDFKDETRRILTEVFPKINNDDLEYVVHRIDVLRDLYDLRLFSQLGCRPINVEMYMAETEVKLNGQ